MSAASDPDEQTRGPAWRDWLLALQQDLARREAALQAERARLEAELRARGVEADDPIGAVVDSLSADERLAILARTGMAASPPWAAPRRAAGRSFL